MDTMVFTIDIEPYQITFWSNKPHYLCQFVGEVVVQLFI